MLPSTIADTVPGVLAARAAATPGAIAFVEESQATGPTEMRWHEFDRQVTTLAHGLVALKLTPGAHVGILAPSCLAWELFHHAVLRAGGVVVGLEPHDTDERLQWIADHAELDALIVHDSALLHKLGHDRTKRYRFVITLVAEPTIDRGGNRTLWTDLAQASYAEDGMLPEVAPSWPATLIYTSGTTGQPKGILYRHEQVVLAVRSIVRAYPSLTGARFVCWLPLANLFQRIMNLVAIAFAGSVYIVRDPLAVLKALPAARPDVFIGVPRFYEKLHDGILAEVARKPAATRALLQAAIALGRRVASARRDRRPAGLALRFAHVFADAAVLGRLRRIMGGRARFMIAGSAPTPVRLLEFFDAIGLPLYEAYGMSENIVPIALNRPDDFRFGTAGKALPENTLRCAEDGELLVKGPGVFGGYFKDEQPQERFTADGYYMTGDYAELLPDGYVAVKGRKSEIIKTSSGRRIAPLGIEAVLQEIPYVDRAVVIGAGRKCLVALLTLQNAPQDGPLSRERLSRDLTEATARLPAAERPAGYCVLADAFCVERGELTPNLKLRRRFIETAYSAQIERLYTLVDDSTSSGPRAMVVIGMK